MTDRDGDDAAGELTIDDREGSFPEQVSERTFELVVVDDVVGTGVERSVPQETVTYRGERLTVPRLH